MGHIARAALEQRRAASLAARLFAKIVIASIGATLLVCVVVANQHWLDRHFVPSFFLPRHTYVVIEACARVVMLVLGAWLLFVARPRLGHFAAQTHARSLAILIAIFLALGASDLLLRYMHLRPVEWLSADQEPRRQPDPRLGWTWVPARTGHKVIGERVVDYAIDAAGYRVQSLDKAVDLTRPTILFTGESVMFGEGLTWEESVPAQVGALLGMQTANLAVHGYGNDQAYMRLQAELPRFQQPVAIVSLFMTDLFGRNLDQDRPHLGPGLVWLPTENRSRLASLAKLIVPCRADKTVDCGVTVTQEVFRATNELARRMERPRCSRCFSLATKISRSRRCGIGFSTMRICLICSSKSIHRGVCLGTGIQTRALLTQLPLQSQAG